MNTSQKIPTVSQKFHDFSTTVGKMWTGFCTSLDLEGLQAHAQSLTMIISLCLPGYELLYLF